MHTRIAPTPSGYLHAGNACSFLLTQYLARQYEGTLRLRIDDIDYERTRPEYLTDIFEVLRYLKIECNYGPADVDDFQKNYSQQLRLPLYETLLKDLCNTGLVFACACSRKSLAERSGRCNCRQQHIPLITTGAAWRVHIPYDTIVHFNDDKLGEQRIVLADVMPHPVVRKKDGLPAYQIVSLSDDLYYDVDYVVRGHDLLYSTAAQLYIAQITGKENFSKTRFFHHPLLTGSEGSKLSKSDGAVSVKANLLKKEKMQELLIVVKQWLK